MLHHVRSSRKARSFFESVIPSDRDPQLEADWRASVPQSDQRGFITCAGPGVAERVSRVVASSAIDAANAVQPFLLPESHSPRDLTGSLLARLRPQQDVRPDRQRILDTETGEITWADSVRAVPAVDLPDPEFNLTASDSRRWVYELQSAAARLVPGQRVSLCHRLPNGSLVDVRREAGRAYLSGVQTCGSVWMCPVCARKITEARRRDVQQMAEFVRAGGGELLFLTLTAPHSREFCLEFYQQAMTGAYRLLVSGKNALPRIIPGYLGAVRALEMTHGANGWHVHFHVLIAIGQPMDEDTRAALEDRLHARWVGCAVKRGLQEPSRAHGLRLEVARVHGLDVDKITDYVCKWGAAEELTKLHTKRGRSESMTPFGMLAAYLDGDRAAGAAFREYAAVMKGGKQLVWSKGFRALVGLHDEWTDEEIAAREPDVFEQLARLTRHQWAAVRAVGSRSTLLDLAEIGTKQMWQYIGQCCNKIRSDEKEITREDLRRYALLLIFGAGK